MGNVFIADAENDRIREVTIDGIITTVAGSGTAVGYAGDNGPPLQAKLSGPIAVAVNNNNDVYISDAGHNSIRLIKTHPLQLNKLTNDKITFNIFPNPCSDYCEFQFISVDTNEWVNVSIVDIIGRTISAFQVRANETHRVATSWDEGLDIVTIKYKNKTYVQKLLKL